MEPKYSATLIFTVWLTLVAGIPMLAEDGEETKKTEDSLEMATALPEAMRSPSLIPSGVTLRDVEGREIQAHLLSAHGELVRIQRAEDEREFDVPISTFDEYTQDRIRGWMETDPDAVQYSLKISAQRNLVDSTEFNLSGRTMKTSRWAYRVKISNQTRNDLVNAQVEYRIFYDDRVDFLRTSLVPGKGEGQQDGQAIDLPTMVFNDEIEFTTPSVELHGYEYSPTRGKKEVMKDSVKGIWIRVIRSDQVIAEYKSNTATMGNLSWDGAEEEIEIRFTSKVRESTESKSLSFDD